MPLKITPELKAAHSQRGMEMVDIPRSLTSHPRAVDDAYARYARHVKSAGSRFAPVISRGQGGQRAPEDEQDQNIGIAGKAIYQHPDAGRLMLKAFTEHPWGEGTAQGAKALPLSGWAEMTNQGLFHAAGIGDLHQTVHGQMAGSLPVLVHHMHPNSSRIEDVANSHWAHASPQVRKDHIRIHAMDFLAGNEDRHSQNLLHDNETGRPLAIDHGLNFRYRHDPAGLSTTYHDGMRYALNTDLSEGPRQDHWPQVTAEYGSELKNWWTKAGPAVRKKMDEHLAHIKDPKVRAHIEGGFKARADHLDSLATHVRMHGKLPADWHKAPHADHDRSLWGKATTPANSPTEQMSAPPPTADQSQLPQPQTVNQRRPKPQPQASQQ